MSLQKDYSQNLIKARVAETIIQELFFDNNYHVYNYGMERTIEICKRFLYVVK